MGKLLIVVGVLFVIIGGFLVWGPRIPFLGKLPGDIYIHKGNVSFYFPVVTCIVISLVLTLIVSLIFVRK